MSLELKADAIPTKLSTKLEGSSSVVTGSFSNFSRDEIKQLIEQHGGKNLSGVSSKTNYLVAGEDAGSSKLEKASKLKVNVITEDEFMKMIS